MPECHINNVLIQFVESCWDTHMQFVDILHLPFVGVLLHYWPHFVNHRI